MKPTVSLAGSKRGRLFRTAAAAVRQAFFLLAFLALLGAPAGPAGVTPVLSQAGGCTGLTPTTVNLEASADTYLSASSTTANYGGSSLLEVNGSTGNPRRTALIKWDLSSIPADAIVDNASIRLNVTEPTAKSYDLYDVLRDWVEDGATWITYDGTNAWGAAGASATSDRGSANLWDASAINATGLQARTLNTAGLGIVQDWIDGSRANYGVIIQTYSTGSDDLIFYSREDTATDHPPRLTVTYCMSAPAITNYAPTDNATGVHNPPNLFVTVYDPNTSTLTVTFYGRPVTEPAGEWASIGSPVNVTGATTSGGVLASIVWPGRTVGVEYEWYATVSDGVTTVTGPVWSFVQGSPTAAMLSYFRAGRTSAGVELSWETASEETTGGFNLLRSEDGGATFDPVNTGVIPPQAGGTAAGAAYAFLDDAALADRYYVYRLDYLDLDLEAVQSYTAVYLPFSISLPVVMR